MSIKMGQWTRDAHYGFERVETNDAGVCDMRAYVNAKHPFHWTVYARNSLAVTNEGTEHTLEEAQAAADRVLGIVPEALAQPMYSIPAAAQELLDAHANYLEARRRLDEAEAEMRAALE